MLDGVSAFGLAANVVQFVDFGVKLVSGSLERYRSTDGTSNLYRELELITMDLGKMSFNLSTGPTANNNSPDQLSEDEKALQVLAAHCKTLADEFLEKLERLKVQGTHRKWKSVKQAVRGAFTESGIRTYSGRLEGLQSQMVAHLIGILRDEQSRTNSLLVEIKSQHEHFKFRSLAKIEDSKHQILEALYQLGSAQESKNELEHLHRKISALKDEEDRSFRSLSILSSLAFEAMSRRYEDIAEAHAGTFTWILNESDERCRTVNFLEWLRRGNQTYWITGKPGSGKSTLMKFLSDHRGTARALRDWAGQKKLVIAHFFFWNPGESLQNSYRGLMQSLLFSVLQQCSEIMPIVCPERWNAVGRTGNYQGVSMPWSPNELKECLLRVKSQSLSSTKFVFFIDGLDEYKGDHLNLVEVINGFITSKEIKLCVSSRPWNVFHNAFGERPNHCLFLEDLTRDDIRKYIKNELEEHAQFARLLEQDQRYEDLVFEIVNRAEGVFLWVFLVVRSLLRGLGNDDTMEDLYWKLTILPTDLEEYFGYMLDSISTEYRNDAARILKILLTNEEEVDALTLSFFGEDNPDFGLELTTKFLRPGQIGARCKSSIKRINARCPDLITMERYDVLRARFLHRTVKDFLITNPVQKRLEKFLRSPFDPHKYLRQAVLAGAKLGEKIEWRILKSEILYIERECGLTDVDILDSMEKLARFEKVPKYPKAKAELYQRLKNRPFCLTVANSGMWLYLQHKLTKDPSLLQQWDSEPLIHIILQEIGSEMSHDKALELQTLECLLIHGADPDERWEGSPAWGKLLYKVQCRDLIRSRGAEKIPRKETRFILEALQLMLIHCSGPRVTPQDRCPPFSTYLRKSLERDGLLVFPLAEGSLKSILAVWDTYDERYYPEQNRNK